MLKKIALVLVILVIGSTSFFTFSSLPEPFPESSKRALWLQYGEHNVSKKDFVMRDDTRETQANNLHAQFNGLPYRPFDISVWFPDTLKDRHHPLIIHTHGLASTRSEAEYVANQLSSHGYIVVAAEYPLTNREAPGGALAKDVIHQPEDTKFILNKILTADNDMGKHFSQYIDPDKIGTMGISLGGMTSALLTYHPTQRDDRIKAIVSIAGASAMFGEKFYENSTVPFMMIAGGADAVIHPKYHAEPILTRVRNSLLVSIKGGSHVGFVNDAKYVRWMHNPDSLGCALVNLVDRTGEKAWYPDIGTAEQGIIYDDPSVGCPPGGTYAKAINPLKQHMLTQVSIFSFFESVFSEDAARRESATLFLNETLAQESDLVETRRGIK